MTVEKHEQWVGLAYIAEHGYPGYPPPVVEEPEVIAARLRNKLAMRERRKRLPSEP